MTDDDRLKSLEARLAALETAPAPATALSLHPAWPLALGLVALALGYLGLGLPQHYYQPLFAVLFLLLFKLMIGGGLNYPLDWLKVPTLQQVPPADDSWSQKYLPHYQMIWEAVPGISDWFINITKIQSMLLIATLFGGLFRFQPFASLTALALLVISFPSYLAFNWDFVILFLVLGGTAIYLQSDIRR